MFLLCIENLNHGRSFGGPFYYDISTIEKQNAVFPGFIDWLVSQYSPDHSRKWNKDDEWAKIRERFEKRQKEIMEKYHKVKDYEMGNKMDSLIQIELDKFKKRWEQAEELLVLKEAKDWEKVLMFANWWQQDGLQTRIIQSKEESFWTEPVWDKKI